MKKSVLILVAIVSVIMGVKAEVKPNSLFSDNMILQREVVLSVWGTAKDAEKVVVSASEISSPIAVRMGWFNYPHVNLFNKDGLPASQFRSTIN